MVFVREHRIRGQAHFLRALDFGVPVSAFHQPAHQFQPVLPCDRGHLRDQSGCARLVRLQRDAKALPLRAIRGHLRAQRIEYVERQLQPFRLFGVDGQVQSGVRGEFAQHPHARHQFLHHARVLQRLIARVQRGQLHRNAVRCAAGIARTGECAECAAVVVEVAKCVVHRARAFAQHVEAERQRGLARTHRSGSPDRGGDVFAEHELPAEQLHGAQCRLHHDVCARLLQQAAVRIEHVPGHRQHSR